MPFKMREHLSSGRDWLDNEYDRALNYAPKYVASTSKIIVSDCDGILTDSKSVYTCDGKFSKTYGAYDKEAMKFMLDLNWRFLFVTSDIAGEKITTSRLVHLEKMDPQRLQHVACDASKRYGLVKSLMADGNKVLFVGDSLSDIKTLNIATWAATTRNAPDQVKRYCDFVSELDGGSGGFADILLAFNDEIVKQEASGSSKWI